MRESDKGLRAPSLDPVDRRILALLQEDARTPNAEIARRVGLVPSAIFQRLRKLEKLGVIVGHETRIDPRAVGLGLTAFIFVKADERVGSRETADRLAKLPEVQELHHVAGEDCYLVKVRVEDAARLGKLLREKVGGIRSVRSTRTTIVLETIKETGKLPMTAGPTRP
ncbi:MAG TPA: Lrp/AsnC family transcriptional regulator [Vicinamibacteria bacterium]|nr:Lrp/AsnC family transcriptional regulator [Vicinamibacteria bacterium]